MRIFPIIVAMIVCAALYLLIFQRPVIMQWITGGEETMVAEAESDEPIETAATEIEAEPISVIVLASEAQEVKDAIALRGETSASRNFTLTAQTQGEVISQPLKKGAWVEEGTLLCELDIGTRGAVLEEARARLAEARQNDATNKELVKTGVVAEIQTMSAQSALEAARANVARAEKEIENLRITAPFSGILETDAAEHGAFLQPGAPCAKLIDLDPINLVGYATELQVARIKVGAAAEGRLLTGDTIQGKVSFIASSADEITHTFRVEVGVPNPDLTLRDGSTASIHIALSGTKGHLLPQRALTLDSTGRIGVRTVRADNTADFQRVTIVRDTPQGVWVTGLEAQVDVIISGHEYVVTGGAVRVTYQ